MQQYSFYLATIFHHVPFYYFIYSPGKNNVSTSENVGRISSENFGMLSLSKEQIEKCGKTKEAKKLFILEGKINN